MFIYTAEIIIILSTARGASDSRLRAIHLAAGFGWLICVAGARISFGRAFSRVLCVRFCTGGAQQSFQSEAAQCHLELRMRPSGISAEAAHFIQELAFRFLFFFFRFS